MSTLRTNAILDASGGTTATVNGIPLRPGVLDPENRIINGAFDFWQRGTSSTAEGYVAADRWINARNGGTVTQSRQSFALGDTLGSNSPTYFLRQAVSGQDASTHYAITEHKVEGVRSYAGQTVTILGWVRRSSGSGNMAIEPLQNFGTGGSPSSSVLVTPQTVTLTSSWAPFAVTFAVPSISGKTLGTNNNDFLAFGFWTSAGSNWNARTNSLGLQTIGVDLWGIHIKQGTHTTSAVDLYRQPELGPELARCQRYCVVYGGQSIYEMVAYGAATSGTAFNAAVIVPDNLRGKAAVSSVGSWQISDGVTATATTSISIITADQQSSKVVGLNANVASGLTQYRAYRLEAGNSTASRLILDAEL